MFLKTIIYLRKLLLWDINDIVGKGELNWIGKKGLEKCYCLD